MFRAFYKVPKADQALVITGWGVKGAAGYKIVRGGGSIVWPVQRAQFLSLQAYKVELHVSGVDTQRIQVAVRGSVVFKVGDDDTSITNAATRFMDSQEIERGADISKMNDLVTEVVHGHLRSIIGGLTVEDLINDRSALAMSAREASAVEMQALGLIIDSLQIQQIDDPTGYITALGEPRDAEIKMLSRRARADRDREATQAEQEAAALTAESQRNTAIKIAGYRAQQEAAMARAAQEGPLADAEARKAVVESETEVAVLEARREESRLVATVNKPADAEAYQIRVQAGAAADSRLAEAKADAAAQELAGAAQAKVVRARGEADAYALRERGLAEASTIAERAKALAAEADAVINQQVAEKVADQLPAIVEAAASAFSNIEHMTVLNGGEGVQKMMADIIGSTGPLLGVARQALAGSQSNGASEDATLPR